MGTGTLVGDTMRIEVQGLGKLWSLNQAGEPLEQIFWEPQKPVTPTYRVRTRSAAARRSRALVPALVVVVLAGLVAAGPARAASLGRAGARAAPPPQPPVRGSAASPLTT